ncbi:MAG: sigma factor, partial [Bacteroidota bacterium]
MENKNLSDSLLIKKALSGDKASLESLVIKHQDYIYNVALTFVGDPNEAADLTQEVLIKVITKLDSFKGNS